MTDRDKEHSYSHQCPHGHNAFSTFQSQGILSYCTNQQDNPTTQNPVSREKLKQTKTLNAACNVAYCSRNPASFSSHVSMFRAYWICNPLCGYIHILCLYCAQCDFYLSSLCFLYSSLIPVYLRNVEMQLTVHWFNYITEDVLASADLLLVLHPCVYISVSLTH